MLCNNNIELKIDLHLVDFSSLKLRATSSDERDVNLKVGKKGHVYDLVEFTRSNGILMFSKGKKLVRFTVNLPIFKIF